MGEFHVFMAPPSLTPSSTRAWTDTGSRVRPPVSAWRTVPGLAASPTAPVRIRARLSYMLEKLKHVGSVQVSLHLFCFLPQLRFSINVGVGAGKTFVITRRPFVISPTILSCGCCCSDVDPAHLVSNLINGSRFIAAAV